MPCIIFYLDHRKERKLIIVMHILVIFDLFLILSNAYTLGYICVACSTGGLAGPARYTLARAKRDIFLALLPCTQLAFRARRFSSISYINRLINIDYIDWYQLYQLFLLIDWARWALSHPRERQSEATQKEGARLGKRRQERGAHFSCRGFPLDYRASTPREHVRSNLSLLTG